MPDDRTNTLLEAVDQLTRPRKIHTNVPEGETTAAESVTVTHPPLLTLLIDGTGITKGAPSSSIRIPIDADALELWGQINDLIKLWCRLLAARFDSDDLLGSMQRWHTAHSNQHRSGKISDTTDHDVTRMVEGWVRMIEQKFDPPERREWKEACPAILTALNDDFTTTTKRCGARRVVVAGEERFAILLNVSTLTAECAKCHTKWEGQRGLMMLRYETNLWNLEKEETAAPAPHTPADTPTVVE